MGAPLPEPNDENEVAATIAPNGAPIKRPQLRARTEAADQSVPLGEHPFA